MITVSSIVYGAVAIVIGTLMIKYTFQLVGFTGRQDWIESKIGSGTTYAAYKFFGVLLVLVGVLGAVGLLGGVATAVFSPLRHLFPSSK